MSARTAIAARHRKRTLQGRFRRDGANEMWNAGRFVNGTVDADRFRRVFQPARRASEGLDRGPRGRGALARKPLENDPVSDGRQL